MLLWRDFSCVVLAVLVGLLYLQDQLSHSLHLQGLHALNPKLNKAPVKERAGSCGCFAWKHAVA